MITQDQFDSAILSTIDVVGPSIDQNLVISNVGQLYKDCHDDARLFRFTVVALQNIAKSKDGLKTQGGSAIDAYDLGKILMVEVNNWGPGVTPSPFGPSGDDSKKPTPSDPTKGPF